MSIMNKLKMLWHDSEQTNVGAINGKYGRFDLMKDDLLVGVLEYANNSWTFKYSPDFIKQTEFAPLVNFPDCQKLYTTGTDQLWPFFSSRIPGMAQLRYANDDQKDILTLLQKYGRHVIANPYVLIPV